MLSRQYMKILGDTIGSSPLKYGELRRVEGLGRRFLALAGTSASEEYHEAMTFEFDGQN